MKLRIFVFAAIFILLTGCTVIKKDVPPASKIELDSQQGLEEQSSQALQIDEEKLFEQQLSEKIKNLKAEDFVSSDMLSKLQSLGVVVYVDQIQQVNETSFKFAMHLKTTSGGELYFSQDATCSYGRFDSERFQGVVVGNFEVTWGGISILDEDTIAVSTLKDLSFYSADLLKEKPIKLDLSSFQGKDYFLLGAAKDKKLGIVVPVFFDDKDGFAFFNMDGTFRKTETFEYGEPQRRWFYSTINHESGQYSVHYQEQFYIQNIDVPYLVFGDCYYNTKTSSIFGESGTKFDVTDGVRRVVLKSFDSWFGHFDPVSRDKGHLALFFENNQFQSGFFFNGDEISPSFGGPNIDDYSGLKYEWEPVKSKISATCNFSDLTITLDFEKQAAKLNYNINPEHLEDAFASSPNKKYTLYTASSDGGGDISFSNIVLKDNETQALRFVTTGGGMYGGYQNIDFLSNDKIFVQTLYNLTIIPINSAVFEPQNPLKIPFGEFPDKKMVRYLFAFVQNTSSNSYIILYGDSSLDNTSQNLKINSSFQEKYNYLVGICDEDGNLLERYDTGAPVSSSPFGFDDMYLALKENELTIKGVGGKGVTTMHGVFDLGTHTYTDILPKEEK